MNRRSFFASLFALWAMPVAASSSRLRWRAALRRTVVGRWIQADRGLIYFPSGVADDPKQQAMLMVALGLLGGAPKHKNFGADLK